MKRSKKYKSLIEFTISLAGILSALIATILFLTEKNSPRESYDSFYLTIVVAILGISTMTIAIFLLLKQKYISNDIDFEESKEINQDILKVNTIIQYNKKRMEIEQEINRLTRELMNSDVTQYIDLNRLVFSGQAESLIHGTINYDNFLCQFGIQKETIRTRKNSAVFLTPFNEDGKKLFHICQAILGGVNIFLKMTDRTMKKDDILMNIVSLIVESELVLVNINERNPNVYYELGIAHALGKTTILLSRTSIPEKEVEFDLRQKRIILYTDSKDLETQLLYHINGIERGD